MAYIMTDISQPRSHSCYAGPHIHSHAPHNLVNANLMRAERFNVTGITVAVRTLLNMNYSVVSLPVHLQS